MKKYVLVVITLVVMMLVGVQAYAQPRGHHPRPHRHHYGYYHPAPRHYLSRYYWHNAGYWYHPYYRNIFLWGDTYDNPYRVRVDCLEFTRLERGRLRVINGSDMGTLSLYKKHHLLYTCASGIKVDLVTGYGQAEITVFSEDGELLDEYIL